MAIYKKIRIMCTGKDYDRFVDIVHLLSICGIDFDARFCIIGGTLYEVIIIYVLSNTCRNIVIYAINNKLKIHDKKLIKAEGP